jgi:hypothetical protein
MPINPLEITIQKEVVSEIQRLQKALGAAFSPRELNRMAQFATVNAAKAVQDEVRAAAPTNSGLMAKKVKARRSRITRPGAIVGPIQGKKGAWYSKFVIYGTKKHVIYGNVGTAVTARDAVFHPLKLLSGAVVAKANHPGARADHFVTETAWRNIAQARDAYGATIARLITDEQFRGMVVGLQAKYATRYRVETGKHS